jgi:death on curing protein
MRYLSFAEVLYLHRRILESSSGGGAGIRDVPMLESALAQPKQTFGGSDLYPSLVEKAAALCFSIVNNHPFVDGNKRVAHAGMESFLLLNGAELQAGVDEQEQVMLASTSEQMSRGALIEWPKGYIVLRSS